MSLTPEQIAEYLALLAESNAKVNNNGPKLDKPAEGVHRYRILPEWKSGNPALPGVYAIYARHWVKSMKPDGQDEVNRAVTLCEKSTYGRTCPVCEAYRKVKNMGLPKHLDALLQQSNAGTKYIVNALHRTGAEPDKVIQLELPFKIGQSLFGDGRGAPGLLMQWMALTRIAYPLDPNAGTDIIIRRSGAGRNTVYSVELPTDQSQPVPASAMQHLADLDALIAQWKHSPEDEKEALTAIAEIAALAFGSAPAPTQPAASQWVMPQPPVQAPVYQQPPVQPVYQTTAAPNTLAPQVPVYQQPIAQPAQTAYNAPFDNDVPASVEAAPVAPAPVVTQQPAANQTVPPMDLDEIRRLLSGEAA